MKIENLDVVLKGMDGKPIKEPVGNNKTENLTLRKLIIAVLKTEKIPNDERTAFVTVNNKSEDQKMKDFNLGWKISQAKKSIDLKIKDEVDRIIAVSHYLDTERYGALMAHINQ